MSELSQTQPRTPPWLRAAMHPQSAFPQAPCMIQSCTLLQLPAAARHGLELRTDVSKTQLPRSTPRGSAHRGFQLRAVEAGVFGNVAAMAGGEIRLKRSGAHAGMAGPTHDAPDARDDGGPDDQYPVDAATTPGPRTLASATWPAASAAARSAAAATSPPDTRSSTQTARLRPSRLATYNAASATCTASCQCAIAAAGRVATPAETVTGRVRSSTATGWLATAYSTRSTSVAAPPASVPGRTSTNSSPPQRTTASCCRTSARRRAETATSTASPAGWPNRSLTCLK